MPIIKRPHPMFTIVEQTSMPTPITVDDKMALCCTGDYNDDDDDSNAICSTIVINYNQPQYEQNLVQNSKKRVIFISYVDLYLRIENIPEFILKEAIFIFKANRNKFFHTKNEQTFNEVFLKCIQEKEREGLMIWFTDKKTWNNISVELQAIPDIYTNDGILREANEESKISTIINNLNENSNGLLLPSDVEKEKKEESFNETAELMMENTEQQKTEAFYKALILDISWWNNVYTKKEGCETFFYADGK